ncbi:unnamed protein product [Phytophthora fragariaefolia]|uniref:Unnamed protein product n=1 Tax=Phytophthora fragariaefolia TaxID=1490495 RepID=A0A9W6U2A5_9STRA|nr:unnamed protein product [Phytophthora fragariaefolia]
MAKMIADDTWVGLFHERHKPMPGVILEEASTSFDYSGCHATSPGTGTDRYAPGASITSRHGNRRCPRYQAEVVEPSTGVMSDQDAQRRPTGPRPDLESLLVGLESCQRLLDYQRTEMVALRARVQKVETHMERLQDVRRDSDRLRDHVGGCLGRYAVLVTKSTACGTDIRKSRRTTERCAKTWGGTVPGSVVCMTGRTAWRRKTHAA